MASNRRAWVLVMVAVAALGALKVALLALALQQLRPTRPPPPLSRRARPPAQFTVRGIDVSHHQGRIDWRAVAASGEVDFAFLKATQGATHTDTRFAANLREARQADIPVGAYHYFSLCRSAESQAAHFIRTVPAEALTLPPAVDVELDRGCNRAVSARARQELEQFVALLSAHYGEPPLLYVGQWLVREGWVRPTPALWIPAYDREPRLDWHFWQYTDRGRVPGIDGPVDRNVFAGTPEELLAGPWRHRTEEV